MAGYKTTVIDDDAVSFWTFDGDAFDPVTRKLMVPTGDPRVIIDEIDNLNPATLHSDNELYLGYRLGMGSMITHEQEDQHSITFGYYGYNPAHPSGYAKSYLEIPHTISYAFPRLGSFTVEFMIQFTPPGSYGTYPIFIKSGVISINYVVNPSASYLGVTHPGGSAIVGTSASYNPMPGGSAVTNRKMHFAFTWKVEQITANNYKGTARTYVNSRIITEQIYNYTDIFPNTNVATPITIAGTSSGYWTSALQLDQIAVYDKALSEDQITNHVAKVYAYDEYLKNDFATNIWPFDDADSLIDFTIAPYYGSFTGQYIGGRSRILRGAPGPDGIQGASAATFVDGGQAVFISKGLYDTYQARSASAYTYEWWFNTSETNRGVMFTFMTFEYPFNGPLVQINMRDNQFFVGCLQFTEADNDLVLNSRFLNDAGNRFLFNDGRWHHIAITRQSGTGIVSLYLDGVLHDQKTLAVKSITQPGQISMMNYMPGHLSVNGSLCFLAYYAFDLQPHQIRSRSTYSVTYRIRGIVTLMGVPYQAKLRFYSSYTGEFIQETESDVNTGEYEVTFYNNSHIDILVFDPNDLSVRYRAYGPVTPSEFDDLPINI
jgi:hypothetical protein